MPKLIFDTSKITDMPAFIKLCPFNALSEKDGKIEVSAACKMCRICVKKGPAGAATYVEDETSKPKVDKKAWKDITVYVDHENGKIHPVTFELLGKARELADKTNQKVCALLIGNNVSKAAADLLHYSCDKVFVYDDPKLSYYISEVYTSVFEDYINKYKPCAILVGATSAGRELAPRVAARFHTGLTADCTILDMNEDTDLIQIRPAFGGNIMAQIVTPNHRPQLATVRYKVMNAPERSENATGEVINCTVSDSVLLTTTEILSSAPKKKIKTIETADVIVAVGRGFKSKEDLALAKKLADTLGGDLACSRPLAEAGWLDAKNQIGLSGRTVRPKLIICCGISGAVQFTAGMSNSDRIFAINSDPNAPIFKVANYGIVGDVYDIIPKLIAKIEEAK